MHVKKLLWIVTPLVVVGGLVAWRASVKTREEAQLGQSASARQGQAPVVQVAAAAPRVLRSGLEAVGTAESPFRVEIAPRVSGRIEYLAAREGDAVQAGQVLVRIDPSELQGQVLQQQAAVAEARSRLAQAQLTQAPTEVGVRSQVQQQNAGLQSAQAELTQVERNQESVIAAADAAVTDARSRLASAEAQVRNARAELERQQASLANATTRFNRVDNLYRQGFIAAQEVDDARTAVDVQRKAVDVAAGQVQAAEAAVDSAKAQLGAAQNQAAITRRRSESEIAAARARVTQANASVNVATANRAQTPAYRQNLAALEASVRAAEAQLQQARSRLAETTLRSPIAGVVTARNADPGALASPSGPVLVVQSLDSLFVTASVPIEQSGQVLVGRQVRVTFDALPKQVFTGPITHVNPAADLQSRQVRFRLKLPNPGNRIKPGMFGRVEIPMQRVEAGVTVPREAIRTTPEGTSTVFVLDGEDTAHERQVVLGASDGAYVQIVGGVQPGERVVTMTYRPLRDGQKVRLEGARQEGQGGGNGRGNGSPRGNS